MQPKDKKKSVIDNIRPSQGEVPANVGADQSPDHPVSSDSAVADFVAKMKVLTPKSKAACGRLIFAMDATMSRQPTWDMALSLQAQMFDAVAEVGDLDVQLVYFRGFGECRSSKWVSDPKALARLMTQVSVRGGQTQIGKVLAHARTEASNHVVNAFVYVGDCMEEDIDELCVRAGELGLLGVPGFFFQEGHNGVAEQAFREMARLTKGAWCRFDSGSAAQLRELLTAVAVYAAGGQSALRLLSRDHARGKGAQLLLEQLPSRSR